MVVNVDNVTIIALRESSIEIKNLPNGLILGEYPHGRAKEVFEDMLEKCFPVNCLVTNRLPDDVNEFWDKMSKEGFEDLVVKSDCLVEKLDIGTYYMPEE